MPDIEDYGGTPLSTRRVFRALSVFPLVLTASCEIAVEEAHVALHQDLSSSAEFLVARPLIRSTFEGARQDANKWAEKVRECGGSARIFSPVSAAPASPEPHIIATFNAADGNDVRLLIFCMSQKKSQFDFNLSKREGWLWDYYTVRARLNNGLPLHVFGDDFLPHSLEVRMPGTIVRRTDTSVLPLGSISWTQAGDGQLTAVITAKPEGLQRLPANGSRWPEEVLQFSVVSRVWKFDWMTPLTALAAAAALVPILGIPARFIWRKFRRKRKRAA
jgi:hypothetical protein